MLIRVWELCAVDEQLSVHDVYLSLFLSILILHVVIPLPLETLNFYSLLAWMTSLQLVVLKIKTCKGKNCKEGGKVF